MPIKARYWMNINYFTFNYSVGHLMKIIFSNKQNYKTKILIKFEDNWFIDDRVESIRSSINQ